MTEWDSSPGEEVCAVLWCFWPCDRDFFPQLKEKKEGRGRGNMFGERVLDEARGCKRQVRKQEMETKQHAVKTTDR